MELANLLTSADFQFVLSHWNTKNDEIPLQMCD